MMRFKFVLMMLIFLLQLPSLVKAEELPKSNVRETIKQDIPMYTLIDTVSIKTFNGMECELAFAMSVDRKEIRIIRLDLRKGTYNVNYFAKKPMFFLQHGIRYIFEEEFDLTNQKIITVHTVVDFSEQRKDFLAKIQLQNGKNLEKRFSIDAEFFKDHASKCLK